MDEIFVVSAFAVNAVPTAGVLLAAWFGGWLVTRWFLGLPPRWQTLDIPNHRSSHQRVTPLGGGIGIVAVVLVTMLWNEVWLPAAALVSVAVVGLLDDTRGVAVLPRLVVHFAAAWLCVVAVGPLAQVSLGWWEIALPHWLGWAVAVVLLVWLLNIYNFMDGIDGLATGEAATVSVGALVVFWPALSDAVRLVLAATAGASLGFLFFNWSPARAFMGDLCSGALGLLFGWSLLELASGSAGSAGFWAWLILLNVFIWDSGVTLLRRAVRGQRVWEGHREHAYQHLAARFGHASISLAIMLVNMLWLMPMAFWAIREPDFAAMIWFGASVPLVFAVLAAGAGGAIKTPD